MLANVNDQNVVTYVCICVFTHVCGTSTHTHRVGASGMLPVHMACLNGYSNCVENLLSAGEWNYLFKNCNYNWNTCVVCNYKYNYNWTTCSEIISIIIIEILYTCIIEIDTSISKLILWLCLCFIERSVMSDLDGNRRSCLHAAACGG